MSYELVKFEIGGRVGTITLNQPEKRNPLSIKLMTELVEALLECKRSPDVGSVLLTGSGPAFCAGADLTGFEKRAVSDQRDFGNAYVAMCLTMAHLGKPIVGAINGYCLAGGLGVAGSCDLLVASETAEFGAPEVKIGLWPFMVMAVLFRSVGRRQGLEIVMLGERFKASEAREIGFVNRVVPAERLVEEARNLAEKLASYSPMTLSLGRDAFYAMADMTFEQALFYAKEMLSLAHFTTDGREGVSAFLQKRKPEWQGR